jgi:hypothetical protein
MKLSDLANIVVVRNHIGIVLNDKSVSEKTDFRKLNDIRIKLDKEFIKAVKDLNFDNLFPVDSGSGTILNITEELKQKFLKWNPDKEPVSDISLDKPGIAIATVLEGTKLDSVQDLKSVVVLEQSSPDKKMIEEDDHEDADMIAERVRQQKEQLKKEGRSNKRISKVKDNASEK